MDNLANIIKELEQETGAKYTESDQRFALELVRTGNQSEAARQAGASKQRASQTGREMAQDPDIQRLVAEINKYSTIEITEEFIKSGLMKEAVTADNSRDRREALHLLGKTKTMFKDGIDATVRPETNAELISRIEKEFGQEAADKARLELGEE